LALLGVPVTIYVATIVAPVGKDAIRH